MNRFVSLLPLLLTAVLAVLTGCQQEVGECSETVPCGAFETCVDGTCQAKSCSSSIDCGMKSYCEVGECKGGCQSNDDCYPGQVCDLENGSKGVGSCVEGACRDTSLDCGFGEFCDPASGDCYPASGYYCSDCRDDDDCGGNGNLCLGFGANGNFCGVTCDTTSDCPAGYDCVPVSDGNGNIITNQCLTYCWLYITDSRGPDAPEGLGESPVDPPEALPELKATPVAAEGGR